jgi:hypothetical protein
MVMRSGTMVPLGIRSNAPCCASASLKSFQLLEVLAFMAFPLI